MATRSMKKSLVALAAMMPLGACATGYYGPPGPGPVGYDGYYDDYYGPIYDGYWGDGGLFYYRNGPHGHWRADRGGHFRRDAGPGAGPGGHGEHGGHGGHGFHPMHGTMHPPAPRGHR